MQLNVPFSEISEHGVGYEIMDSSWIPDDLVGHAGSGAVHIRLTKKNDNSIELRGKLQADVTLECDRCLKLYAFQVNSPMLLLLEVVENDKHRQLHNIETGEVELETVSLDSPVVDLAEILRQQLLLALPEKLLCRGKCLGLCKQCGANLNDEKCGCGKRVGSSPFAVLEVLKKKN
jgi:uncharacterized protein